MTKMAGAAGGRRGLDQQFQWLGIPLARSTMTDLFHAAAEKLKPLYLRLLQRVANLPTPDSGRRFRSAAYVTTS